MNDSETGRGAVVFGYAFSPTVEVVLREAARQAQLLGATLIAVHSGQPAPDAEERIREQMTASVPEGVPWNVHVEGGSPAEVLVEAAETFGAIMIVAGALERDRGVKSSIFGSVARRLVRHAPCSVLLVPATRTATGRIRMIVACVDPEEKGTALLEYARDLANSEPSCTLHIVSEARFAERFALRKATESERIEMMQTARLALAAFVSRVDYGPLTPEVEWLEEATEGLASVSYSQEVGADLLLYPVAQRPLTFLDRFFSHPVEVILEKIPCRILFHRTATTAGGGAEL